LTYLTISRGQLIEGLGLLKSQFPHPVQGESVQSGAVALRATHPEEFPLETFVGLLEKGEDDSSCHPAEAYPEVLPRAFGFEEMKKKIYSGWMTKMVVEDGDGPYRGPIVGM